MTASDKDTLYHFFSTAESWLSEGTVKPGAAPLFTDDESTTLAEARSRNSIDTHEETGFDSLEAVAAAVRSCTACALAAGRIQAVPGIGPENPVVLVIGEGPGADEDEKGEPFVGKAGQLLDKMLSSIELSRATNCYIANVVKCRPPQNRDPLPEESAACAKFLRAQIALIKPAAILAVGRIAAQNLLGTTTGIGKLRGQFFDLDGIPLMPTYHPSALLRDETLKRPTWEDLKTFRVKLLELAPDYPDAFRDGNAQ
jgi:DNA polymerase